MWKVLLEQMREVLCVLDLEGRSKPQIREEATKSNDWNQIERNIKH
jgi:hypothetical protein